MTQSQSRNSFDLILDKLCDMFDAMLEVVAGFDPNFYKLWVEFALKNRLARIGCSRTYTHMIKIVLKLYGTFEIVLEVDILVYLSSLFFLGQQEKEIRQFAGTVPNVTTTGDIESMALYAGEGVGLIREILAAGEVVRRLVEGAQHLIHNGCSVQFEIPTRASTSQTAPPPP